MHLNEFAVGVVATLLVKRRLRRSGAHNRVRRLAKDRAVAAGGDDDGVGWEGADFHAAQIHGADAAADAVSVEHGGKKFPVLVLLYLAFGFVAADLFIERIKQLLAGGRAGERSAVVQSPAEAAKIEQSLGSAVERNAHAIEQIDDAGRGLAHVLDRRLVRQKIAAVNRVIEMLPRGIAFALQVLGGVDATLRAYRMRTLHRNNGEQIDAPAHLGNLDDGGKSRQSAADDDDFRSCHLSLHRLSVNSCCVVRLRSPPYRLHRTAAGASGTSARLAKSRASQAQRRMLYTRPETASALSLRRQCPTSRQNSQIP